MSLSTNKKVNFLSFNFVRVIFGKRLITAEFLVSCRPANAEIRAQGKMVKRRRVVPETNVEAAAQRFPIDKNILRHNQVFTIINEGSKGVKPQQSKIKEYFLSGIAENVKESQIMSYLKDRNVSPTYISLFQSQRQGSVSAKINIPSLAAPLVEKKNFCPMYVRCKLWRTKYKNHVTLA